jgi:ABC-type transporter Mla MlaB component
VAFFAPRTITFAVWGPIQRTDLPGLSDRVCKVLDGSENAYVYCDVAGVPSDAVTVEALARLQLAARRNGCRIRLRNVSTDLLELLELMGLTDVIAE